MLALMMVDPMVDQKVNSMAERMAEHWDQLMAPKKARWMVDHSAHLMDKKME